MIQGFLDWLKEHPGFLWGLSLASLGLFLLSLLSLPWLVGWIPRDYFVSPEPYTSPWDREHRGLRVTVSVLRTVLGALFVVAGVAMLVLPGQGVLTILAGILLLEFPGKRRLERWLVARPRVLTGLNWLRRRAGKEPLEPPASDEEE